MAGIVRSWLIKAFSVIATDTGAKLLTSITIVALGGPSHLFTMGVNSLQVPLRPLRWSTAVK